MSAQSLGSRALLSTCFHSAFLIGLFFDAKDGGDESLDFHRTYRPVVSRTQKPQLCLCGLVYNVEDGQGPSDYGVKTVTHFVNERQKEDYQCVVYINYSTASS